MNKSPVPFARRALKRVDEAGPGEYEFTVVSYNILADHWIQFHSTEKDREVYNYGLNDLRMRRTQGKNSHRHTLFMEELRWLNSDIICLQEVDTPYFKEILADEMSQMGYQGLAPNCMPAPPESVAMFFKRDKFELEETKTYKVADLAARTFKQGEFPNCTEVVLLAALRHKISENLLVIGTTHMIWGELLETVTQVCQISLVTNALADMVKSFESRGEHVSHILCGDFNIEPQFPAYQLLREGRLNDKEMRRLKGVNYIRWSPDVDTPPLQLLPDQVSLLNKTKFHIHHPLTNLQSAYKTVLGVEPQFTNHEGPGCVWTLDYIWFDSAHLKATASLETVSKSAVAAYTYLPKEFFPSDHLSLKAHFKFAA